VLTILYFIAIRYINRFFKWAWLMVSRYCEYRQDYFAYSLENVRNKRKAASRIKHGQKVTQYDFDGN
jgi:hypothetical protein